MKEYQDKIESKKKVGFWKFSRKRLLFTILMPVIILLMFIITAILFTPLSYFFMFLLAIPVLPLLLIEDISRTFTIAYYFPFQSFLVIATSQFIMYYLLYPLAVKIFRRIRR